MLIPLSDTAILPKQTFHKCLLLYYGEYKPEFYKNAFPDTDEKNVIMQKM